MEFFDLAELWDTTTIKRVQLERLRTSVAQALKSPFYAKHLGQAGLNVNSIKHLDDLRRIPFTTKEALRDQYPYGLAAVPIENFVRMHCSSGTTGIPVAICHTENDVNNWASLMARCLHMAGLRKNDVFQNMSGYGLFTGGLGIHYGAERIGCMTIPAGAGNSKRQLQLMRDFQTTAIHILPSYALHLGATLQSQNEEPAKLPVRIAIVGAEPYTEVTRNRIEELFNMKVFNSYGLSEMNGPGVAFECQEQYGMHIWEDAFIAEIINPDTEEPMPYGEIGELVMTTLCREGMPVLRYRTRDLTHFITKPCPCGRTHQRINRITARTDDMIILKGVNIYPMQIERILMKFPEIAENYLIVLENDGLRDSMKVQVELKQEYFTNDPFILRELQDKISRNLHDEILITPKVQCVQINTLPRSEGKAQRVKDIRQK